MSKLKYDVTFDFGMNQGKDTCVTIRHTDGQGALTEWRGVVTRHVYDRDDRLKARVLAVEKALKLMSREQRREVWAQLWEQMGMRKPTGF